MTHRLFYVLLTVHLSIILVINQLNAQKSCFIVSLSYSSTCFEHCCAHHQEVKIVLHSIWYHTETSEWSKITKIQFYKYEHMVVKFIYEFFGCDYCVTYYNHVMSCRGYVYPIVKLIKDVLCLYTLYVCWGCLVIKSYKLLNSCYIYKVTYIVSNIQ